MRYDIDTPEPGTAVLKLTAAERRALADVIVDEVAGRVPVFVGAGAATSRRAS